MARFTLLRKGKVERSYCFDSDLIRVGRLDGLEITLDSTTVSREHARIERVGSGYVVEDAGSVNGVRVNGEPVKSHTLSPGEFIEVEDFRLQYEPPEEVYQEGLDPALRALESRLRKSDPQMTFLNVNRFLPDE